MEAARNERRTLGMFLTEGFSLMSYASVIEPFRAANILAGKILYDWRHISIDGAPVQASTGASILSDQRIGMPLSCDTLFVFAAGDPAAFGDAATFAWLRRLARDNVRLAGVSGGPFLLARAGLLEGYRATIHWDHRLAFEESFPSIPLDPGLYVIDRRRVTCAGGTAALDLAVDLIEREHGNYLASRVGEWFIRTEARGPDRPQRTSLSERYGVQDDRVLKALAHMEANVEEPVSRDQLAKVACVSIRQLERLFQASISSSISDTYLAIRVSIAQDMLSKTRLPVTSIALACGFRSSSHFSQVIRKQLGKSPSALRAFGGRGNDVAPPQVMR